MASRKYDEIISSCALANNPETGECYLVGLGRDIYPATPLRKLWNQAVEAEEKNVKVVITPTTLPDEIELTRYYMAEVALDKEISALVKGGLDSHAAIIKVLAPKPA